MVVTAHTGAYGSGRVKSRSSTGCIACSSAMCLTLHWGRSRGLSRFRGQPPSRYIKRTKRTKRTKRIKPTAGICLLRICPDDNWQMTGCFCRSNQDRPSALESANYKKRKRKKESDVLRLVRYIQNAPFGLTNGMIIAHCFISYLVSMLLPTPPILCSRVYT